MAFLRGLACASVWAMAGVAVVVDAAVAADAVDILKDEIKRVRDGKGAQKSAGRRVLEQSCAYLAEIGRAHV